MAKNELCNKKLLANIGFLDEYIEAFFFLFFFIEKMMNIKCKR